MQMESKFIILKVKNQSSRYQHLYVCNKVILTVFKTTLTKQVIVLVFFFLLLLTAVQNQSPWMLSSGLQWVLVWIPP